MEFNFNDLSSSSAIVSTLRHESYKSADSLDRLYNEHGLTLEQIGDRFGCSRWTVGYWMKKYGLPRTNRVERATYDSTEGGYERWRTQEPNGDTGVCYIHQLQAVADGEDPDAVFAEDTHVHHRNGIPYDNRPDNLEVVSPKKHSEIHQQAAWEYDERLGCKVLVTAEAGESDA